MHHPVPVARKIRRCGALALIGAGIVTAMTASVAAALPAGLPNPQSDDTAPTIGAPYTLAQVEAWLPLAVRVRTRELNALSRTVARLVPAAPKVASEVTGAQAALVQVLAENLTTTTSASAVQALAQTVVDQRVFAIIEPQVAAVSLLDSRSATIESLDATVESLAVAIATDTQSGRYVTAAQSDDAALETQVAKVEANLQSSVTAVSSLTPGSYPATTTFGTAQASAAQAATAATTIRKQIRTISNLLAHPGAGGGSTNSVPSHPTPSTPLPTVGETTSTQATQTSGSAG
jgi:hypothetical protein